MTALILSLACLLVLAIQGYSCVRRRTSRRGKAKRDIARALELGRRLWPLPGEDGWSSASALAVPKPRPSSRPFIAPVTTSATSGSSRPASADHHRFRGHDGAPCLAWLDRGRFCDLPETDPLHGKCRHPFCECDEECELVNLTTPMVPISEGPCMDRAPSSERARTCVRCGVVHHNPCYGAEVASSRKQFGMCDYPEWREKENAPGPES